MNIKKISYFIVFVILALSTYLLFNVKDEPIKTSGALQSLQYWHQQRAYPDKHFPAEKFYKAYVNSNIKMKTLKQSATDQWEAIGPQNIGGRTLSLAFNPQNYNTIYAGSASGGLWVTHSGGIGADAWDLIQTGYPVLGVSTIAVHPADSNIIYIGSGEVYNKDNTLGGTSVRETRGSYGIGILKTTDGGQTWNKSLDWTRDQSRGVWMIKINPDNPNSIWAGTTEGTYRTYNAGNTWELVDSTVMVTDLIINPSDTAMIWIACGNLDSPGKGIYRTDNGGETWNQLPINVPDDWVGKILLSHYSNYPSIIYASVGYGYQSGAGTRLIKSTDYGDNWEIINTYDYATYQGWFSHYVAVFPDDSSKLICGGVDVYKSSDGGNNLEQKSYWYKRYGGQTDPGEPEGPPDYVHSDQHNYAFHPDNPNIIYFACDGGVFRTLDGGETFEGCNGGYQTSQFYNGFYSSINDSLLALGGMQDNGTAIWHGTLGWYRAIGGDGGWAAIDPENDQVLYGSTQYLGLRKSYNGGESFGYIAPSDNGAGFIAPYDISINNHSKLYAGTHKAFVTTNGGNSWNATNSNQPLNGDPLLAIEISPSDDNIVYATTAPVNNPAGLYITTNGGETWLDKSFLIPDRYPMDIAVNPFDPSKAYVVFSGFDEPHILKTTDLGENWEDITGDLPNVPTSAIAIDPEYPEIIYIGNDLGVYFSNDEGNNWYTFNEGLSDPVIVMDLSITPVNRTIRVVTHGSGVFNRKLYQPGLKVNEKNNLITDFRLEQNYPNPFNPVTKIRYQIPSSENVTLKIFDILGNEVETLINKYQSAGNYEVNFYGKNLSSGVYLYKLTAGNFSDSKKFILEK